MLDHAGSALGPRVLAMIISAVVSVIAVAAVENLSAAVVGLAVLGVAVWVLRRGPAACRRDVRG